MMCFHSHVFRCDLVLPILSLIFFLDLFLYLTAIQISNREHSSITLYQGTDIYDLDAKDCPVGVALVEQERFSCACINGIWAFYDNPCQEPIAIVGGNNHCFQMPQQPIRMAVAISNPLRGMGESLTVLEEDLDGIRSKVYRNTRLRLTDADKLISLNSSWTLISPDGTKSICLESRTVIFEGLTSEEAAMIPNATYCSFTDLSNEMPFLGAVKKGCDSSMVLEPIQCQPMLPNIGEEICMSDQILKDYQEAVAADSLEIGVNLNVDNNELDYESATHNRPSRALNNLGRFLEKSQSVKREATMEEPLEIIENGARAYQGEPEWYRRWLAVMGPDYQQAATNVTNASFPAASSQDELKVDLEKAWKTPRLFLNPPSSNSNQLITNHLWMFRRTEIRNVLNITRLVPPEDDLAVQVDTGKVKKLLSIHKDIMKKICPLVSPSFFDTVSATFLGVLTKGFRWKEPYLEQTHYLRIVASLSLCKKTAVMMKFSHSTKCSYKNTGHIGLQSMKRNETVYVKLDIPEVFRVGNFEPLIESVWKIFVAVHSYCFKDFSGQYQDHHKYTTLMMGLFSNKVHNIWMRNQTFSNEYAGILGNIQETMHNLETCAAGARMTSEYPFHMNRPTMLTKYQDDKDMDTISRRKRSVMNSGAYESKTFKSMKLLSRKKRLTVNSMNSDNTIGNTIFGGRGLCLKNYKDQKSALGINCKKRGEDS